MYKKYLEIETSKKHHFHLHHSQHHVPSKNRHGMISSTHFKSLMSLNQICVEKLEDDNQSKHKNLKMNIKKTANTKNKKRQLEDE